MMSYTDFDHVTEPSHGIMITVQNIILMIQASRQMAKHANHTNAI